MKAIVPIKFFGLVTLMLISFASHASSASIATATPNNAGNHPENGEVNASQYEIRAVSETDTWALIALSLALAGLRLSRSRDRNMF